MHLLLCCGRASLRAAPLHSVPAGSALPVCPPWPARRGAGLPARVPAGEPGLAVRRAQFRSLWTSAHSREVFPNTFLRVLVGPPAPAPSATRARREPPGSAAAREPGRLRCPPYPPPARGSGGAGGAGGPSRRRGGAGPARESRAGGEPGRAARPPGGRRPGDPPGAEGKRRRQRRRLPEEAGAPRPRPAKQIFILAARRPRSSAGLGPAPPSQAGPCRVAPQAPCIPAPIAF